MAKVTIVKSTPQVSIPEPPPQEPRHPIAEPVVPKAEHQAMPVPPTGKPEPKFTLMHNCSTCMLSLWDHTGQRDEYSCRNQASKYHGMKFFKNVTYPGHVEECWVGRDSYSVGEQLRGDAR